MKAITLISGGLDSLLAAKLIKEQGVGIIPLNFKIPFHHLKPDRHQENGLETLVKDALGEKLKVADINKEFLRLLLSPEHGFGAHMNPCIDCKILMLMKSKELMAELGAQFIVTGEVLGQRPMSQHKKALKSIEQKSGLEGFLLRPLCAKNLIPTIPEERGWVNRDKLLSFSGRSRRPQISLAREFSISGYPNASGGCLLTDRQFSVRIKDLIRHKGLNLRNIELLKFGRHFRLGTHTKLIVGRSEKENKYLEDKAESGDFIFMPEEKLAGPTCLGIGDFSQGELILSARIASRYCDSYSGKVQIDYKRIPDKRFLSLNVLPAKEDTLASLRI